MGADLLVNISDLAWFHKSNCGRQMIAFSVFRAVENRRYFIFAANTGPSALIDPRGTIAEYGQRGESQVVCGKVGLNPQVTPFALWYR
jgi:Apolipoprotein N-acyltransferase